ncbi:MAG: hypothetical protein V2I36_12345 [Desulfopila sp.]|jgi:M6 family metalloprotease-like protein|nr:hypothetical protein [Desulfopila sp.]
MGKQFKKEEYRRLTAFFYSLFLPVFITFQVVFLVFSSVTPSEADEVTVSGLFATVWGDSFTEEPRSNERHFLYSSSGDTLELIIDPSVAKAAGGLRHLNGALVSVTTAATSTPRTNSSSNDVLLVHSLEKLNSTRQNMSLTAATGSQPWVSIMCKFQDFSTEPKDLLYFKNMYASTAPGLNHYWKQASYNRVNLDGSNAYGWYVLPHPRSYYIEGGTLNFSKITRDCAGKADADVYFPAYSGINFMFNYDLDGYAWGGSQYLTMDGRTKQYRVTWEPPWGYSSLTVMTHEMGHGFGMPHSSGNYGRTYDNVWDVMSDPWTNCGAATDRIYGCLGQHTIGYHRQLAGWLDEEEIFTYQGDTTTITLERLTLPSSSNYRLAKVPISRDSHYYTVEVRQKVGYDSKLPADAVIIHEVDELRANGRDAYLIDIDNNGTTGDAGAIWQVGETFADYNHSICIAVTAKYGSSHSITIGCNIAAAASQPTIQPSLNLLLLQRSP